MKSLRAWWARLRRRAERPPQARPRADEPRIDFSYTVYWTKQARQWDPARRAAIRAALTTVLAQPGFEANPYARRYRVPGLDEQAHAGASLVALDKVLRAFGADEP